MLGSALLARIRLKAVDKRIQREYAQRDAGDKPSRRGDALKTIPPDNSVFFILLIIVLSCVNTGHKGISGSPADDSNH